jgi:uncharacterized protein YndB with AHSA1/START domain
MADIEITTEVKRPVEEVSKLVTDIPNYSKWVSQSNSMFIENKVSPPGPVGVGTTFEDKLRFGRAVGKVVEYKPSERIVIEQKWYPESHVSEMRVEYHFEPLNGNTRMTHRFDVAPVEIFAPMKAVLTEFCRQERQRTCEAIKATLEK